MGIFLLKKNILRCPKCGGYYEKNDGFVKCFECGCTLISEDEYKSYGYSNKPTVTCPYCKSTNTKKISGTSKVISAATWGLLSQKVKHQWHCNDCGSDF